MNGKACIVCGSVFAARHRAQVICSDDCRREKSAASKRAARMHASGKPCVVCGVDFTPRHSAQTICSDECRLERDARRNQARRAAGAIRAAAKAQQGPTILRLACQQCGTPMETTHRRKYCRPACRKAHHVAKFKDEPLDYEGEIPVAELDDAPRRAAVARLFDKYDFDEGGRYYHGPLAPTWINPADRRAGR